MIMPLRALLVLWLLSMPAAATAPLQASARPDVLQVLGACRFRLDVQDGRIVQRCPELAAAISAGAISPWLPRGWNEARNDLSAGGLGELSTLLRRLPLEGVALRSVPDPHALTDLLRELQLPAPQRNSLWQRFRGWLQSLFARPAPQSATPGSLRDWLRDHGFSDDWWSILQWLLMAAFTGLVLITVSHELRASGAFRRRRFRVSAQRATAHVTVPTPGDIESAPLLRRPGLLLTLLADLLARRRLLPGAVALTAREVAGLARIEDPEDRRRLQLLAAAAEPARFGSTEPAPAVLAGAVQAGRELLAGLGASVER